MNELLEEIRARLERLAENKVPESLGDGKFGGHEQVAEVFRLINEADKTTDIWRKDLETIVRVGFANCFERSIKRTENNIGAPISDAPILRGMFLRIRPSQWKDPTSSDFPPEWVREIFFSLWIEELDREIIRLSKGEHSRLLGGLIIMFTMNASAFPPEIKLEHFRRVKLLLKQFPDPFTNGNLSDMLFFFEGHRARKSKITEIDLLVLCKELGIKRDINVRVDEDPW